MNIEWSADQHEGIVSESSRLHAFLHEGKRVLWLLPGGSNIPIAVAVLKELKDHVTREQLSQITVTLTDERYGAVGHADSNWKQLTDAGFDFSDFKTIPVLTGKELEETILDWSANLEKVLQENEVIVGHFGMGADGHIAGILPHSPAVDTDALVCGYEAEQFTRITLTLLALKKVSVAYLFAFGASKETALHQLHGKTTSLEDQPAQVLQEIPEVHIYSDHIV